MNRLIPIPSTAIQCGADFFIPEGPDGNPRYLMPGETEWRGPFLRGGGRVAYLKSDLKFAREQAVELERSGVILQVSGVGGYIRTHRLPVGPARKLSDWKRLAKGGSLLLHPDASPEDTERAARRVAYMRNKGFGRYHQWTDATGALWVTRE